MSSFCCHKIMDFRSLICLAPIFFGISVVGVPTDFPACSNSTKEAYVDVILVIDTSSNMGNGNLKKISTTLPLVLSKFPIGNLADITLGYRNTRIAVITYDTHATIVANFTDINRISDLTQALGRLQSSTSNQSNLYDGMIKAFRIKNNCTDIRNCSLAYNHYRPTAIILFAASANSPKILLVPSLEYWADYFDYGTLISVNFNPRDQGLSGLLKNLTWNLYAAGEMYNFLGSSSTLAKDLEWAITQANCYCAFYGIPLVYYDQGRKRYSKNAQCFSMGSIFGPLPDSTTKMCAWHAYGQIPAYVLSEEKTEFIERNFMIVDVFTQKPMYPFFIGLHKNQQREWAWYDYDLTEFSMLNFTDWSSDHRNLNGSCGSMDSNDQKTLLWKPTICPSGNTGLNMFLCQAQACDSSSLTCLSSVMNN